MSILGIAAAIFAIVLIGLVVWVLVQNTQDQKKNEQLESQMNELRRDLLGLSTSQTQSSTKMETIAGTVAERLEAVTQALQSGIKDSAQTTSQITSQAQVAMATELKNTRDQISQVQKQLGEVQQAGQQMHETAEKLQNILGGTKSRGSFGEVALERLLEDCLPPSQYEMQSRFRSGETADAVLKLRDGKKMAIDSKFPLDAYLRLTSDGEEARRAFVTAVKGHADSIAKKYIVPEEGTLDVALMFVPSETVYYELLMSNDAKGQALDAYCRERRIMAVSPNTLYAHLSVIAMGLRGMQIEENAKRLSENLTGMRKQMDTFCEYFEKVGVHLKNAQQSFTEADKRFSKVSNSLDNLVSTSEPAQPAIEDVQGILPLPPAAASKRSA
ncbi:MAG TPA: DNA recombination protein RmuC [Candidatus Acidoferrum sp.]